VANVRDMGIPKPTVFTAPDVSNAQAIIALNIAHVKKKSEYVRCVLCNGNHPANYKDAPFTKKYKNEPFHH